MPIILGKYIYGEIIVNKFSYLVLAVLVVTITVFSGCTLVTTNQQKYMSQIVASATSADGNYKVEVTMEEFLTYYSNYASSYIQNGMTNAEATEQVVNLIINRKLFVDYLKDYKDGDQSVYTLSNADINDVWTEVYNYVYEQLDSYENEVYDDWGIENETSSNDAEESTDTEFVGRTQYEHEYTLVNGVLTKVENEDTVDEDVPLNPNPFKSYFWQAGEEGTTGFTSVGAVKSKLTEYSDGLREEEMSRFVRDLRQAESYQNYEDTTSWAVFERELNRVYEIQLDNKYIEKYQEIFEDNYVLNGDDILSLYNSTIKSQMELYSNDLSAYNSAMGEDNSTVYYHPTQGWFYVSHLLIGFNDDQTALIDEWDSQVSNGIITQEERDANVEGLRSQLKATARDSDGNETDVTKSASEILSEVNSTLAVYGSDANARINAFTDLIYKYTTEASFLTRDFDYAIPFDEAYDTMVEEFANASREVQKQGLSSVTGLVYTEYGAHIIMFTGVPQNASITGENTTLQDLWNTPLKSSSDKNMLDLFAEQVTRNDYSVQQTHIINQLRDGMDIVINKSRLSDYYAD